MNYEILFRISAKYRIDLNWLIFGVEDNVEDREDQTEGYNDPNSKNLDKRAHEFVNMIRSLPWPSSTKRKIIENYIQVVREELGIHSN